MGVIVQKIGQRNNCTFCEEFRRQTLDRGAMLLKFDKIVTGHNAIVFTKRPDTTCPF